ncbi:MAG: phosphate acetyltransferase [Deltaproteobacteria bacterium]|nr:MAG: phosphate acetyltransferase [Deltaproteobacteria bacterium]
MGHTFLVVPTGHGVGLSTVSMGLLRACERQGFRVGFHRPIAQPGEATADVSTRIVRNVTSLEPPLPVAADEAERMLSEDRLDALMERVVEAHAAVSRSCDVVVVEGLWASEEQLYAPRVNAALARALDAEPVLVCAPGGRPAADVVEEIEIGARGYDVPVAGVILNMVASEAPPDDAGPAALAGSRTPIDPRAWPCYDELARVGLRLVGAVPLAADLLAPRVCDLADALHAEVLFPGEMRWRRVRSVTLCGRAVPGIIDAFRRGSLLIFPSDRHDVLMAASLASLGGEQLAGLLLTHGEDPDERVLRLCRRAFERGLPVLRVSDNSLQTAVAIDHLDRRIPADDRERAEAAMNHVASHIDAAWLRETIGTPRQPRVTPAAFRHQLIQGAREAQARIVLPEGDEPRTVKAAAICQERGIARCVLLADPSRVRAVAADHGVRLPESLTIIDPLASIDPYVGPMVELRRHKGLTESMARDQLQDPVVLGTMMLQQGEVDGLVSGAVHTTANTIRPALQLIRTRPGFHIVSSCFFMLLPEQVLVFADCAVNPDPDAEQLAEIAIATADTAAAFGIEPIVAMISYATGDSAGGAEVEKVARATAMARERRPDLEIDGPLQYDAALVPSVGAAKAPGSPVAGRARVFIFPDLNTGNTTYKAVQRSAGVVSIGPVLQGLARPVNDLSRGATVEDIVFTIAITAIQARRGG